MKAFKCVRVTVNSDLKWILREVEDGGVYRDVAGRRFYDTLAACEVEMLRLDEIENGDK